MLKAFKEWLSGQSKDGTAYKKYEEYIKKKQDAQDQKDLKDQNAEDAYAEQWLKEKTVKEYARWMKSQKPDKSKSDQRNIKGSLKDLNRGGLMKTGHIDYRKGGMVYTTKNT
jgi:hypothetical protein